MRSQPDKNSGFTLIELMVTVAIAAVIMGVAIPSFIAMINTSRLTSNANELVTALNLARSEAVKRGIQVTVRRLGTTSAHWEGGWEVFVDSDGSNAFNDDGDATLCESTEDCKLRTYTKLPDGFTLTTGNSAYKDYAAYLPSGLSKSPIQDTFTLCNGAGTNVPKRAIKMSSTGRPSVDNSDGACS